MSLVLRWTSYEISIWMNAYIELCQNSDNLGSSVNLNQLSADKLHLCSSLKNQLAKNAIVYTLNWKTRFSFDFAPKFQNLYVDTILCAAENKVTEIRLSPQFVTSWLETIILQIISHSVAQFRTRNSKMAYVTIAISHLAWEPIQNKK